ncbi:MAG: OmpA family protein [Bacteroidetes bacterium]|nr:OmpA family protein [Bacteroidota bacterium]
MSASIHSVSIKLFVFVFILAALNGCVSRPWRPTNVGRESGPERTPLLVSHIPEKNQWTLTRTKSHNVFQQIICFNYVCRRLIGRNKLRQAISMKDFKKRLAKNAKEGAYKNMTPVVTPAPIIKKQKRDSVVAVKDTTRAYPVKKIAPVQSPLLKADSLITLSDLLFEFDSYRLKEKHYSQLDSLSAFLIAHPTLEVSVSGHTDNRGDERHNVMLSARRAEVVAHYLIGKGVSDEKIMFEGFGSSRPISENKTENGRSKNRRVEILLRDPKKK